MTYCKKHDGKSDNHEPMVFFEMVANNIDIRNGWCMRTMRNLASHMRLDAWWHKKTLIQQYFIALNVVLALLLGLFGIVVFKSIESNHFAEAFPYALSICVFGFSMDFLTTTVLNFFWDMQCFQDYTQSFLLYLNCVLSTTVAVSFMPPDYGIHLFFLKTAFHDALIMVICEYVRHVKNLENQDDEFRIIKSLEPFLSNLQQVIWDIGKVPIFDAILQWFCFLIGIVLVNTNTSWTWERVMFFPIRLFLTDLVNDTFYWMMHRYWHTPAGYPSHKFHHTVKTPVSWVAAVMTTEEMFVTFLFTRVATPALFYLIFGPWPVVEYLCYQYALVSIEILGHSGQVSPGINNTCRFGQGFLTETLGINLEIGHHDLHHELSNVNFGKRLCLMDKLMGTFKDHREKRTHTPVKNKVL